MKDPLLWDQHPAKERATLEGYKKFFKESIDSKGALVVIDNSNGEVIGSSRYKLLESDLAIEIGWTVLSRTYWGGKYNSAMKELMINHAHDHFQNVLLYIAKENIRSQKAAEKIGGELLNDNDQLHLLQKGDSHVTYAIAKSS